jgi:hypothetical protein
MGSVASEPLYFGGDLHWHRTAACGARPCIAGRIRAVPADAA